MAKKIYQLPLLQTVEFIKAHKSDISKITLDKQQKELFKLLGKSYYLVELEKFMQFFKILNIPKSALKNIEFFCSVKFIEIVYAHLDFEQFGVDDNATDKKDFFYAFCYILHNKNTKLFEHFFEKLFLHYRTAFSDTTDVNINFKEISFNLARQKGLQVKESFGETPNGAYFKIVLNEKIIVEQKGKVIKTLRKKAYKKFFDFMLDFKEDDTLLQNKEEAYKKAHELGVV